MRRLQAAVLGANVGASRSPAIHEAAWAALGVSGRYLALDVAPRRFPGLVGDLAAGGLAYVNVTIPHKRAAARLADSCGPTAAAADAANTLVFGRKRAFDIRAENTDGAGLLDALADLGIEGWARKGQRAMVLVGSGGAAAGALVALAREGAAIRVLARRPAAARRMAARLPSALRGRVMVSPWTPAALAASLDGACALVSAVPAAAWAASEVRRGLDGVARDTVILEMAYGEPTPLARSVRGRVRRYADGLPMLVHQAARAVEIVLGRRPLLAPLFRAARG